MSGINLPLFIGSRYSKARRRSGFISFISFVSLIGIALGVWVLITVISVMNGFEKELRGRILDVASHVTISGNGGWLRDWESLSPTINKYPEIVGHAPFINGQGLVTLGSSVNGALIRGILPSRESEVSAIKDHLSGGSFDDLVAGEYNIILGEELSYRLNAVIGDKVTLISPQGQSTPAGLMPRLKRFTVVGTFGIGMNEYDGSLALVHITDAGKLYKSKGQVSGIRLKLNDVYQARAISNSLAQAFDYKYFIGDWTRQHENFFRALVIEKRVMFIILFLIVAIAAFNIVSTLVMVVTDKRADIAILRTLGLSPRKVMGIFFVQGVSAGIWGTIIGGVLGVITAINVPTIVPFLEGLLGFELFPGDVYVISDFPAELRWSDVTTIVIVTISMSMVATLYPAWRASKTQPAEALRYE